MEREFKTMQELVASLAQRGERECLLWFEEEGSGSLTYKEFGDMALAVARGLKSRGIQPGRRVGLFADNRWQTVVLAAGIVLSGGAVTSIDPQFSGEILEHVLRDAAPDLLLGTEPQEGAVLDAMGSETIPFLYADQDDGERSWRSLITNSPVGPQGEGEFSAPGPGDIVALFYTSGTTGRPKGVPLSHANLVYQQRALIHAGLTAPGDRVLLPLPLHHVYPFVVGVFAPLTLGVTIILPRAIIGAEIIRAVREGRASIVIGIPRLYEALVSGVMERMRSLGLVGRKLMFGLLGLSRFVRQRFGWSWGRFLLAGLHKRMGPELRIMASGGAPLDSELAWTMEALGWKVGIGYGLTETSPILSINPPDAGRFHSVGQPLPGVEMRIAPGSGENRVGEEGEIQVRGPGVFSGYKDMPDKTREAFTEDGWFRTGDLGCMEDGWLVISGRASTMIVTRSGENIQPDTVEQALDKHPLLRETGVLERDGKVAVLAVPDIVASRHAGMEPEEAARRAVNDASRALPSYQRPAQVAVSVNPIERTRLGKIRRHKLEEHFDRALQGGAEQDLGPMDPREMSTADRSLLQNEAAGRIWDLLARRYPKRRLTPDADLAGDLGIDSLEWLDLSLELGERAGLELDEERIATLQTVRDLLRLAATEVGNDDQGSGRGGVDPVADPEAYLDADDKEWLEPITGWRLGLFRLLYLVFRPFLRMLFGLHTKGLEHLDAPGPLIITPNHLSYLDAPLLGAALPFKRLQRIHFIAWQGAAFGNPVLSFLSRMGQAISIDPAKRPGTSMALTAGVLARGRDMILFPEGMRSKDGELQRLQPGLGRILAQRDARVVPVLIQGTREAMPTGRLWIKPTRVTFTFGEPVPAEVLRQGREGESPSESVMRNLREMMLAMAQQSRN